MVNIKFILNIRILKLLKLVSSSSQTEDISSGEFFQYLYNIKSICIIEI